ncbi:MAG: hypothetical protein DRO88_06965 [Promethearchaeia archaeon]|nr:MAG: hypothetical protein DRO88_06965 [Candidatus Lokiarchaeia archaeon]
MFFIGINLPIGNEGQQLEFQATPQASTSIGNIGIVEGDVLYYHYWNEYTNPEDYSEDDGENEGVVRIEVREINTSLNKIFYDFYMINMTEMQDDWNWVFFNEQMENDSARWLEDDFEYNLFNHTIVFPNNITDLSAVAADENLDQLIMNAFECSWINSEYSDGTSVWNTVYFEVYPNNGPDMMSISMYINKTTGLMTYYEENEVNHTMHLELAGFDLINYDFYIPDSFGVTPGDWVDRFVPEAGDRDNHEEDLEHGYYPDWLESNDDLGMARDLYNDFGAYQGKWFELNTFENDDYYKFWADSGDNIEVYVEYAPGADVVLYTIDPGDGSVIANTTGEEDPDGWASISWTAEESGYYYFKINGSDDFWGDKYNFGIIYNGDWGPEFWPDPKDGKEDHDRNIWIHEIVDFIYYNPYFDEDVLITSQEFYREPTMLPEDKAGIDPMRIVARVNSSNPNTAVGEGWFHKDIDFTSTDFLNWFDPNMILWDANLSSYTMDSGIDWLKITGVVNGSGEDFYFFAQKLPGVGTVRFYQSYMELPDEGRKQEVSVVIDCSVAGTMTESASNLGVVEGDWWTYVVQNEWRYDEWGSDMEHHEFDESVMMVTFTVTHIFALNFTTMGVVGSMEVQIIHNDGSIDPEQHLEGFQPFLIYDTLNPVSFMTMGGLGHLEGPPVLLPAISDWSTQETAMLDMFATMPDGPGNPIAWNFQEDTVRLRFDGFFDDTWEQDGGTVTAHRDWKQDIVLDVNEFGMTTHLRQEQRTHEHWTFDDGEGGSFDGNREKEERILAFMSTGSKGCVYETDIASITALQPMDTLVWERSRYHPAGEWGPDDPGEDPADKSFDKIVIGQILSACDKYVVFLGAQFWKGPGDTEYHPHEWHIDGPDGDIIGNFWYLDSIRKDDIWTWINSNIFDMSVTDFATKSAEIIEILNFAFAPDASISASDITFNGTTFEVESIEGNIKHVFRFAVNDKGIMQDMFMGDYDTTTNEWLNWERNVLVEAPSGYDVGEYFMTDIPSNYVPSSAYVPPSDDTTTDDTSTDDTASDDTATDDTTPINPFGNIPGYTTSTVLIFSLIGVVALTLKKRK